MPDYIYIYGIPNEQNNLLLNVIDKEIFKDMIILYIVYQFMIKGEIMVYMFLREEKLLSWTMVGNNYNYLYVVIIFHMITTYTYVLKNKLQMVLNVLQLFV